MHSLSITSRWKISQIIRLSQSSLITKIWVHDDDKVWIPLVFCSSTTSWLPFLLQHNSTEEVVEWDEMKSNSIVCYWMQFDATKIWHDQAWSDATSNKDHVRKVSDTPRLETTECIGPATSSIKKRSCSKFHCIVFYILHGDNDSMLLMYMI